MHVCPKLNWKPAFGSPQFGSPHYLYATLPDHNCLGDTAGQILLTALEQQDRLLLMPLLPMWGIMRIDAKLPADDDAAAWSPRSGLTRPQLMRSLGAAVAVRAGLYDARSGFPLSCTDICARCVTTWCMLPSV